MGNINFKDISNKKFGRLTVLEKTTKRTSTGCIIWKCICECGNYTEARLWSLKSGHTTSCGCKYRERSHFNQYRHNALKHGMWESRIYHIWASLKSRCNSTHKDYGGRGITYDPKWETFEGFYEDMKSGYSDNLSIDRIDVNGNYSKENCRWATTKEQSNNRRNTTFITYDNKIKTISEWCNELNLSVKKIGGRIRKGWSPERAFNTPFKKLKDK